MHSTIKTSRKWVVLVKSPDLQEVLRYPWSFHRCLIQDSNKVHGEHLAGSIFSQFLSLFPYPTTVCFLLFLCHFLKKWDCFSYRICHIVVLPVVFLGCISLVMGVRLQSLKVAWSNSFCSLAAVSMYSEDHLFHFWVLGFSKALISFCSLIM